MKEKRNGLLEYASQVHKAKLDGKSKSLLWHYAFAYNWTESKPSFYSQDRICALVGMSPTTYQKHRKILKELGWIIEVQHSYDSPVFVTPKVGRADPNYTNKKWSKGHPDFQFNLESAIDNLPENFKDPFSSGIS